MSKPDHRGIGMTSQRTRDRMVQRLMEQGICDHAVLDVMRNTPRHIFIDEAMATRAYDDCALPIGYGQTISQPYTVARMTEILLSAAPPEKVLEIGTGSGYQSAVLAQLVKQVCSVERTEPLIQPARRRFQELKLRNIRVRHGDGFNGWEELAPYDGIIVTAAPRQLPEALLKQLAVGGRMVIPLGVGNAQVLTVVTRTVEEFVQQPVEPVVFVPLQRGAL